MSITHARTITAAWLLIGTLVGLIYWQGLSGPFLLDDWQNLAEAKVTEFSWQEWLRVSMANRSGPLGRPLSILSFIANDFFWGNQAFYYKAVNLFLHLTTGILLYFLLTKLTTIRLVALLTSLLWLIHPLQVSTVLYAVQRMTQLSSLFLVLGMLAYSYDKKALSLLIWPLAIFSKEPGVLLPFYLLAIDYFILQKRGKNLRFSLYWSLLTACLASLYYIYQYPLYLQAFHNKGYTIIDQLLTQSEILCVYLRLILLPNLGLMGLFNDDITVAQMDASLIGALSLLGGLFFSIYYYREKQPILAFGLAFFFISHLVESTILPLELSFEHRNYLALMGILFIVTYYTTLSIHFFRAYCFFYTALIAIFSLMTFERVQTWSDPILFLKTELIHHPRSARANVEWANFLFTQAHYSQSYHYLDKAKQYAPTNAGIPLHQYLLDCRLNQAPTHYAQALYSLSHHIITPYTLLILNTLVHQTFYKTFQYHHADQTNKIMDLINAAMHNPHLYQQDYLATLYHLRAGIQITMKKHKAAIEDLDQAYKLDPKRLTPLLDKIQLQIWLKDYPQARDNTNKLSLLAKTRWLRDRQYLAVLDADLKDKMQYNDNHGSEHT